MAWAYYPQGRVKSKTQTVVGITKQVQYAYTNGDLTKLITPSGQTINYAYSNHRITGITIGASSTSTILSGVTYDPFGPALGWTWGNSTSTTRVFDLDGMPSTFTSAGASIPTTRPMRRCVSRKLLTVDLPATLGASPTTII